MQVSGSETLTLPQMSEFSFIFRDIVLSDNGQASITFSGAYSPLPALYFQSGKIRASDNNTYFASYNTGEAFSVSGWFLQNGTGNSIYGLANDIAFRFDNIVQLPVSDVIIATTLPTIIDVRQASIDGPAFDLNLSFQDGFPIGTGLSGNLTTDVPCWVFGSNLRFYSSLENLLTGTPIIAFVNTGDRVPIFYTDADTTKQNNSFSFDLFLNTFSGQMTQRIQTTRTGLYNGLLTSLFPLSDTTFISGLFDGVWSGKNFVYQDSPSSLTLNYFLNTTDSLGNSLNEALNFSLESVTPSSGGVYQSSYITGFTLTSSGEYTIVPTVIATGYYYVTGLQQGLETLLFSSGCTGNLNVTFSPSNGLGTGASGYLSTHQVLFKDIYGSGINPFFIVDAYNMYSSGTGYTLAPRLVINTGAYGSRCFDVPKTSGFNVAYFRSSDSSGAIVPSAVYLSGIPLYTTGLVSGGATTGIVVTGIDITNIGSGYSSTYVPKISFVRQAGDTLSGNASGTFSMKATGSYNFGGFWSLDTGLAGKTLTGSTFVGSMNLAPLENYVSFRLKCSGLDNTQPVISILKLSGLYGTSYIQYVTGAKYFSTDPNFLKKKSSVSGEFSVGNNLTFLVTQSELDVFYSTAGFTNNNWTIDVGDLDF